MKSPELLLPIRAIQKYSIRAVIEAVSRGVIIEGKENLPEKPPFIIGFNHFGWLEAFAPHIVLSIKHWPYIMTKIETMRFPFGPLVRPLGFFGINRGEADTRAIKIAFAHLRGGHVLATAPEGTRGRGENRLSQKSAKTGLVFLATKIDPPVPLVPMAVWGQNEITFPLADEEGIKLSDLANLRRQPLHIRIGEPLIPILDSQNRQKNLSGVKPKHYEAIASEFVERIYSLLPPDYLQRHETKL